MQIVKFITRWMIATLAALVIVPGCRKDDKVQAAETIAKKLTDDPNLSLFRAAMIKARLETFTEGPGPFTVFAPDNDAFKANGINTDADLAKIDSNTLVQVMTYHIIASKRLSVEIPIGPNAPIATQYAALNVFASKNDKGMFFNGTKVTSTDIECSNGVIHVVNKVLIPPVNSILNYLMATPNHQLLLLAVGRAGPTTTISPATSAPVTVFAPTNAAFLASGLDSAAIVNTSPGTLTSILRYHIVSGRLFSSDFKADSLKTLHGSKVLISLNTSPKVKGIKNAGLSNIFNGDYNANNGVVHAIDSVLKF